MEVEKERCGCEDVVDLIFADLIHGLHNVLAAIVVSWFVFLHTCILARIMIRCLYFSRLGYKAEVQCGSRGLSARTLPKDKS